MREILRECVVLAQAWAFQGPQSIRPMREQQSLCQAPRLCVRGGGGAAMVRLKRHPQSLPLVHVHTVIVFSERHCSFLPLDTQHKNCSPTETDPTEIS